MNGRNPKGRRGVDQGRDAGGFIALPWSVVDSAAYQSLGHPARSLLTEIARQFTGDNNGRMLASMAYLGRRGWRSADVVTRAKKELIEKGLIHEMVKGHRPNRATWIAITWRKLDPHQDYDFGTADTFERRAYEKWGSSQNRVGRPAGGIEAPVTVPSHGVDRRHPVPRDGAAEVETRLSSIPSGGNHLDKPSPVLPQGRTLH